MTNAATEGQRAPWEELTAEQLFAEILAFQAESPAVNGIPATYHVAHGNWMDVRRKWTRDATSNVDAVSHVEIYTCAVGALALVKRLDLATVKGYGDDDGGIPLQPGYGEIDDHLIAFGYPQAYTDGLSDGFENVEMFRHLHNKDEAMYLQGQQVGNRLAELLDIA